MKKTIVLVLMVLLVYCGLAFGDEKPVKRKASSFQQVTKTYMLEHVSPDKVRRSLDAYFIRSSFDRAGKMFTVTLMKDKVSAFEAMLKKLDVEKKRVMLRIFTVVASNEGSSQAVANRDLDKVLKQLQKVLSFKNYRLDGVSALTVVDGQERSRLTLASKSNLRMDLGDITVRNGTKGRSVGFQFEVRQERPGERRKDGGVIWNNLISSETSVKENGYLVAGVSKIGKNGDSLILIINAKIM